MAEKILKGTIITSLGFLQATAAGWRQDSTAGMAWPNIDTTF